MKNTKNYENIIDSLKLNDIKQEDNQKLINLSYKHYFKELEELLFYDEIENPYIGGEIFDDVKIYIDKIIINEIPKKIIESKIKSKSNLFENNPACFDPLTHFKIVLCSKLMSFYWYIPYTSFYNFYHDCSLKFKSINIDLFIAKIKILYLKDNDNQFDAFELYITEKYKN